MAQGSVNRRGPKRSAKSLASERATTTRRITAGKFTAVPPVWTTKARVRTEAPPRIFGPQFAAPPLLNPFPGFKFRSPLELTSAVSRWQSFGRPPIDGRWMPPGESWFLAFEGINQLGITVKGGAYFDEFPSIGELTQMMAEWGDDDRYPSLEFVRVTFVRYNTGTRGDDYDMD